jgi:hypothetical protein
VLEWENWIPCEEFPKLLELAFVRCPKLVSKLPNHLALFQNIVLNECRQLVVSISSFPELYKLEIEGSKGEVHKGEVDFGSLHFSSLSTISKFTCQIERFIMEGPRNVEDLTIETFEELTPLWSNDVGLLQHLPRLYLLNISNCSKLVSFVAKEMEEQLHLSWPSKKKNMLECEN